LLDVIEFIIIDDGSPLHYEIPNFNINLRWIKINENIKWNQAGARNLGVLSAKSDKFIITDLDHVFYEDTLKFMVDSDFKRGEIYKFRHTHIHKNSFIAGNYPSHGNVFAMRRGEFLAHFGYDEETDMKIIFVPSILKHLGLSENILQNADIFTAKETMMT
jgi:hypothetical protein